LKWGESSYIISNTVGDEKFCEYFLQGSVKNFFIHLMVHYSDQDKNQVIALTLQNVSPQEISRRLEIYKATIYRWIAKAKNGDSLASKSRSGRPPKLDDRAIRSLVRNAGKSPKLTANDLGKTIPDHVAAQTVRKYLKNEGIHRATFS